MELSRSKSSQPSGTSEHHVSNKHEPQHPNTTNTHPTKQREHLLRMQRSPQIPPRKQKFHPENKNLSTAQHTIAGLHADASCQHIITTSRQRTERSIDWQWPKLAFHPSSKSLQPRCSGDRLDSVPTSAPEWTARLSVSAMPDSTYL